MRCRNCGFENPPQFKFCGDCGTSLIAQTLNPQFIQTNRHSDRQINKIAPEAERRQLTVMFCDLVDSTPLAERLDPEELRTIMLAYQETSARVIRYFDGYLARYIGDGLLVYFGYPTAHEDDAQRAVRAGLGIVDEVRKLDVRLRRLVAVLCDIPLRVRVGIHTGLVVAGDMGTEEFRDPMAIVGETPNLAARLQGIAAPNAVVISSATAQLTEGLFKCHELGPQVLKGVQAPERAYRVLGEGTAQSRFEVAVRKGLTPLIGREEERALLLERWQKVQEGEGQVVLLSGEAGIGKSRVIQEVKERVAGETRLRLEFRCSSSYQNSALYPVINGLQRLLLFRGEGSSEEKLGKLERVLSEYHLPLEEVMPLFASLLSLPPPIGYPPLTLSPQKQKQKTQEALVKWLMLEAEKQAVLLVWEDLQWADPSTLEVLSLFMDYNPAARILTLLTFRPEFVPPWGSQSYLTSITLGRLDRNQVAEMVTGVARGKALPAEVVQQVVAKTDGIPLFVEELTKMVLGSGLLQQRDDRYELTGSLPSLAIPSTLQDSLMARLDRLSVAKEVAQLGATLGHEFIYGLLHAVSPLDEITLRRELTRLVEAEILYQSGLPPQARYVFKHVLIQEEAYHSLLKSKRQQYHRQIAPVLEKQFAETVEVQPELVAHHYTQAGLVEQAIPYWLKAGQRSAGRSANIEAVGHLTKGLELLKALPDTPERVQQELVLQTTLGPVLMGINGYAAPEVAATYARARELCQQVGETPQLFLALGGLCVFYLVRAELQTARELAEQCLRLAQSVQDQALLLWAHSWLGIVLHFLGELVSARAHLEQGLAIYDPQQHSSLAFQYGNDPGVLCFSHAAWTLWLLGYQDEALKKNNEALTLAQGLSHPNSLACAMNFSGWLHLYRQERQTVEERSKAMIALSTEQDFAFWLAWGTIQQGWTLSEQGQAEEGLTLIHQGMASLKAIGEEMGRSYCLGLLAEAYGKAGQAEKGLAVLEEALDMMYRTGGRYCEAELHRIKGELLLS